MILARGLGTRMRKADDAAGLEAHQSAVADSGIKGMIPIGRPFLDFVISALADAGFSKVCLVVGPEHGVIRDHYIKEISAMRIEIAFAVQEKPLGTANAVLAAEPVVGTEEFVVTNSDNYYPVEALTALRLSMAPAIAGFRRRSLVEGGNVPADRVARFGALDVDENGFLKRILVGRESESAPAGLDALASMNCWHFDQRIFDACRRVPLSARNEYELPQAVQLGIDSLGMRVRVVPVDAGVLDLSSRSDVATVAERLKDVEVSL